MIPFEEKTFDKENKTRTLDGLFTSVRFLFCDRTALKRKKGRNLEFGVRGFIHSEVVVTRCHSNNHTPGVYNIMGRGM